MPRTDNVITKNRNGKLGFFGGWAARKAEAKQTAAEEAARVITNSTAKNETSIVNTLASIDFLHSRLPKDDLAFTSDENRKLPDLEFAAKYLQQEIIRNPQTIHMDTRPIDEKLLTLAIMFRNAVQNGYSKAAFAAKAALLRSYTEIRTKVPENQPELFAIFTENSANYLDGWIALVNLCQLADQLKDNIDRDQSQFNQEKAQHEQSIESLKTLLEEDEDYHDAYAKMLEGDSPNQRKLWTELQREIHGMLIERKFRKSRLNMANFALVQKERELLGVENKVENMKFNLLNLRVTTDPNLTNQYKEQMELFFKELEKSDQLLNEELEYVDSIDGRIAQLNRSPGSIRAKEVALQEAYEALEDVKQLQRKIEGIQEREGRMHLIYTQEELKEMKRQNELVEAQLMQDVEENEDNNNYN